MTSKITQADILQWAKEYDGPLFHAALMDPPYHLTSITERFGGPDAAPAQFGKDGAFQRASRGFMNATWDGGDIAFRSETWAALGNLLHPGAFLMAFGGTRGYHRMACAIEDAGFIIHPAIGWINGSGFPKATRIDTQVDKAAGVERQVTGHDRGHTNRKGETYGVFAGDFALTAPATDLATAWQGHRYGLQALKPSFEFICIAQKPYEGRPLDCITRTGAGALNIDGGRVATSEDTARNRAPVRGAVGFGRGVEGMGGDGHQGGRWPPNLALIHDSRCNGVCVEGCPVRVMGEQSGDRAAGGTTDRNTNNQIYGATTHSHFDTYADEGTAARYFPNFDWMLERLEAADPFLYCAKASTTEREAGLDAWQPTTVGDGRQTPIDNAYQRGETQRRNIHPTVKNLALCKWLAALLLPPAIYAPRRLLVPFCGVASEIIGAHLAGWEHIDGVELDAAHCAITRARFDWWRTSAARLMTTDPAAILALRAQAVQASLFEETL